MIDTQKLIIALKNNDNHVFAMRVSMGEFDVKTECTCNNASCWDAFNKRLYERDFLIKHQDTVIGGLVLSIQSHTKYRNNLETSIRRAFADKADEIMEGAKR